MAINISRIQRRIPSPAYLWVATLIFAASNSVTRRIIDIGNAHLVNGRNPISLCNVLFVGNICAFLLMTAIFHRDWKPAELKKLRRGDWIGLSVIGILSGAIVPALIFSALAQTNVANIVLIGRLEPLLTLALSVRLLGVRIDKWTIAGSLLTVIGVGVIAFYGSSGKMIAMMGGLQFGEGELFVAMAAVISSIATIVSKSRLRIISLGVFSIYRTVTGTVVFFILANVLYGRGHFAGAFSPFLWGWMLLYAGIIVVLGQLCWLMALKKSTAGEISLANSCNPIFAVVIAYLILNEIPSTAQYWGGGIIFIGIILNAIATLGGGENIDKPPRSRLGSIIGMINGFKGL
ncbi:MAG: hypothetical protein N5P05_002459 [Chroococcopsis gigantea SAG 12.99]|jgi:drug/metabolite transporter (DMT)-like permease|nr:hypothetical protein [Chroococcopsis gigantea SAG 12.99]